MEAYGSSPLRLCKHCLEGCAFGNHNDTTTRRRRGLICVTSCRRVVVVNNELRPSKSVVHAAGRTRPGCFRISDRLLTQCHSPPIAAGFGFRCERCSSLSRCWPAGGDGVSIGYIETLIAEISPSNAFVIAAGRCGKANDTLSQGGPPKELPWSFSRMGAGDLSGRFHCRTTVSDASRMLRMPRSYSLKPISR